MKADGIHSRTSSEAPKSKKRKLSKSARTYYAVKGGENPGVYLGWDEASPNVVGMKRASCKRFSSEAEAREWLNASSIPTKPQQSKKSAMMTTDTSKIAITP